MTDILLYGIVGDYWDGLDAATLVPRISDGDDDLNIRINTPGGYVMEGLAIYNAIVREAQEGRKVTVYIDGLAASMGSVLAMAGQEIIMAEGSLMMIHNPWDCACGDANELRKTADQLDKVRDVLLGIYSKRSGLSAEQLKPMMDAETWLSPTDALAQGFCTSIGAAMAVEACAIKPFGFRKAPDSPRLNAKASARGPKAAPPPPPPSKTTENSMPNPADPGTGENKPVALTQADIKSAADQAVATERARVTGIRALGRKHKMDEPFVDELIADAATTLDCAREKILDKLAEAGDAQNVGHSQITVTADAREKWTQGAVNWILVKAGVAGVVAKAAKARGETINLDPGEFRGMRNSDLAREALINMGVRNIGRDPDSVVRAALQATDPARHDMYARLLAGSPRAAIITQSTGDFPVLLEIAIHKTLQASYAITPDTWSRWCGVGTVTDFRDHNRYVRGTFGALDTVNENGEFKNKPIPDGAKEKIKATTKGNIINLSRQAIVNDDMSAFSNLATDLGRAAKLSIEVDAYATLASNPVMADGVAFFHATHGNLNASGLAPSVTSFDGISVAMAKQKDVSGNEYLEIAPAVGLFPKGLESTAKVINNSQYDPDTANKLQRANPVSGLLQDICGTVRLSGLDYFFFADPQVAPAFEVAFLDGNTEPFVESELGWRVDGVEWKVRHDYGVAGVGWRNAYKQTGA